MPVNLYGWCKFNNFWILEKICNYNKLLWLSMDFSRHTYQGSLYIADLHVHWCADYIDVQIYTNVQITLLCRSTLMCVSTLMYRLHWCADLHRCADLHWCTSADVQMHIDVQSHIHLDCRMMAYKINFL